MIELFAQRWPLAELVVRAESRAGRRRGRRDRRGHSDVEPVARDGRVAARCHRDRSRRRQRGRPVGVQRGSRRDAIFESVVPVVSAVGHEIDVTDRRPRRGLPCRDAIGRGGRADAGSARTRQGHCSNSHTRLFEAVEQRLRTGAAAASSNLASRPALRRPLQRVRDLEQRLGRNRRAIAPSREPTADSGVGRNSAHSRRDWKRSPP